ncbi:hypothetical protein V6N13_126561 [Hibiscus sabdariffa]|uniref:Uncharacterized protein n=1 Tax=Hibiscus sabdariffa TaxID=183260 RepID=A0ABR2RF43_9ROSI
MCLQQVQALASTLQDKATSRWRGGPRSSNSTAGSRLRQSFNAAGQGHLKVARWSSQHQLNSRQQVGRWRCHVSEDKATSRWRGGPRSTHQLHRCTTRWLESLHRPTRPPQAGELLLAL